MITHPFPPLYDSNSKILILGSFPSVKSREQLFFYGHQKNRFWKVVAAVFQDNTPVTIIEKKNFLLKHGIALWDVIGACEIEGSADSTIKNVTPNDLSVILQNSPIEHIFINGKTAFKYYEKYTKPKINRDAICLPSTSPANAAFSVNKLIDCWKIIK